MSIIDKEMLRTEIMDLFTHIAPDAYHIDDAAHVLQIRGHEAMNKYFAIIEALVAEKWLSTKDGAYYAKVIPKSEPLEFEGIYKRYRHHFGFVVDTGMGDIFVPVEHNGLAMNNDKVRVRVTIPAQGAKNAQGRIVEILEHANTRIVGTFQRERNFGFVVPDDERIGSDIYVDLLESMDARSSAKVLVEIKRWPDSVHKRPEGSVIQVLGYKGTPGVDVSCIVAQHDIPMSFPESVEREAQKIDMSIKADAKRWDLRQIPMITIDGEDAKDLDDAVSITPLPEGKGYRLGVHIADVSHYVRAFSALDKEAYARGTSVYLVDRVIPMLPPVLSNGICSLNANEDRYALTCMMDINEQGKVVSYKIQPSLIHIDRRCNYAEVYKALTQQIIPTDLEPYMDMLKDLHALMKILHAMRIRRGALDFDFPEYKVVVDDNGTPLRVLKRERTIAERIIEECMLIANETVATFLEKTGRPAVYRIHEEPKEEKVDMVKKIMAYLGSPLRLRTEEIVPQDYQKLLATVAGTEIEKVAQMMVLRSMQQAKYTVPNKGHFGLASSCYTHFTSPIRRYPDLMVHRLVKQAIGWHEDYHKRDYDEAFLVTAAEHSSQMEQRAVETEREVDDLKKAEYMLPFVGQAFTGHVSSITSFGMFIELDNGIDGLVSLASMEGDYFVFDEDHFALVGRHTGMTYHLGQEVTVTLVNVDIGRSQIDFVLGDVDPVTLSYKNRFRNTEKNDTIMKNSSKRSSQASHRYSGKSSKKKETGFKRKHRNPHKKRTTKKRG